MADKEPKPVSLQSVTGAQWQLAIDSAEHNYWDVNLETGERLYSPNWFAVRGLDPSDSASLSHESWLGRIHADDIKRLTTEMAEHAAGVTDAINHEYRERHADGHYIWIMSKGRVIARNAAGEITRCVGTDTDITAIKDVTAGFHSLMHRHRLAMDASKVGVWEFDVKTQETIWDEITRNLFQVTNEEMKDRGFWKRVVHPDDLGSLEAASAEAVRTKSIFTADYRISPKDGTIRHVRTRAAFYDDTMGGSKLIGIVWDVTPEVIQATELRLAKTLAEEKNQALIEARARIERDAQHDVLTGLPNRRQLDSKLAKITIGGQVLQSGRTAVFHIDLDRFKNVNDSFGHAAGDAVLVNAAALLKAQFPSETLICRAGGDEFVAILEGNYTDLDLLHFASCTTRALARPFNFNGQECRIGASIGVAVTEIGSETGEQLLLNADLALYKAKAEGRNRVNMFTPDMLVSAQAGMHFAGEVMRGLEQLEFEPFYQPQFDARTGSLVGVEALARWNHPQRGLLAPAEFLSKAEELNVVAQIDDQIMQKALAHHTEWKAKGLNVPKLSVNVSARRLSDPKLLERLSRLKWPKGLLSFELLESIYLEDENKLIEDNVAGLRALGITIELDDFGTGHASIAGLIRLRPDRMKIDRSLIMPIISSVQQRRLVRSIIDIGKALNIAVVAEGVETQQHVDVLKKLDCDIFQGYFFSRPLPAQELATFLQGKALSKAA